MHARRHHIREAHLPSNDIDPRPHSPLEEFQSSRLANAAGTTDEDTDKVLDEVALAIAGADGFGRYHLQRLSREEVACHCIDGGTGVTTQSDAELDFQSRWCAVAGTRDDTKALEGSVEVCGGDASIVQDRRGAMTNPRSCRYACCFGEGPVAVGLKRVAGLIAGIVLFPVACGVVVVRLRRRMGRVGFGVGLRAWMVRAGTCWCCCARLDDEDALCRH